MKKITLVAFFGLLMTAVLVLVGCKESCPGSGNCTVTITQGTSGLYVDTDSPRSSCGQTGSWNYSSSSYSGGCKVANMMSSTSVMRYGTHGCDCDVAGLF